MRIAIQLVVMIMLVSIGQSNAQELWQFYEHTNFEKYKADNAVVTLDATKKRVVFMGNSITEVWPIVRPAFFKDNNYIGRGISGQTTPQMLLRFKKDVIDLNPKVVVILAGINDIAQNTGFTPISMIADNIKSMAELARFHDIEVVICSVLPALDFPWSPGFEPANKVIALNTLLHQYAIDNDLLYVDYHTAMKNEQNGLKVPEYTTEHDLVHPNEAGYMVMEKLVQPAIEQALIDAALSVPPLFTDHMVLQQKEMVTIWGEAHPKSQVEIKSSWGETAKAVANMQGKWELKLETPKAGGPYQISIRSLNSHIQINDVMIGEVWLASGQSNMAMPLKGWPPTDPIDNAEAEIANAQYPDIRMFKVVNKFSLEEEDLVEGKWDVCTPRKAPEFSATAYFFARSMYLELKIPIGIIHSSWGGTPAEAWTSRDEIKKLGDFEEMIKSIEDPNREQNNNQWFDQWEKTPIPIEFSDWNDLELIGQPIILSDSTFDKWSEIQLPGRLDVYHGKDLDGVFWFKKTIQLDDISSDYTLQMGVVDDTDVVYINGEKIGATTYDFRNSRSYPIPQSLLKKGENIITIRVVDTGGPGSINDYIQLVSSKNKVMSLSGKWNYLISAEFFKNEIYQYDLNNVDLSLRPDIFTPSPYSTPSSLYNAMIHPLLSYKIKGAIWYQGESNVGRAEQYKRLFPAMIQDWRNGWGSDFPFYYVQIAPYKYQGSGDSNLDESQKLRDAQRHTLSLDQTGMVVTLDIGNNKNIHPGNKQDVGARLAGLALANDYDKKIMASGPLYKRNKIKGKSIYIEFDHSGSGLMTKDAKLTGFEIAESDQKFVSANAVIKGNKVIVSANEISKPKYVRYAWRDTSTASLFNKEGLPASSFSTVR